MLARGVVAALLVTSVALLRTVVVLLSERVGSSVALRRVVGALSSAVASSVVALLLTCNTSTPRQYINVALQIVVNRKRTATLSALVLLVLVVVLVLTGSAALLRVRVLLLVLLPGTERGSVASRVERPRVGVERAGVRVEGH